jgi:TonB family protein
MSPAFKRYFLFSLATHLSVVLVILVLPFLLNLRKREKPREITMFVDLQTPPVAEAPQPEETVKPPPKKPPKKIEKSTRRVRRPEPKPDKPKLTEEQIRDLLEQNVPRDRLAPPDDLPAWYYALVRQTMYEAWDQPSGVGAGEGASAQVEIRVLKNGNISRRRMTRSSGSQVMDDSIMKAVRSVTQLRALPAPYPRAHKDITIEFELTQ